MSDNGSGDYGWPTGPTYAGLTGGIAKALQGYLQGRQMRVQQVMAQLAYQRQQALADSLMQRRADQTTLGREGLGIRQQGLDDRQATAEDAQIQVGLKQIAAMAQNPKADPDAIRGYIDSWGAGLSPAGRVKFLAAAYGGTSDASPGTVAGSDAAGGAPAGSPAVTAASSVAPPVMAAPAVPTAPGTPPSPTGGISGGWDVVAPPAPAANAPAAVPLSMPSMGMPPGRAPLTAPSPSSVPASATGGTSAGPWWARTNPARVAAAVDPYVKEYNAAVISPDFAKLPAPIQDARINGWRQQITAAGGNPDALGVVSTVQGGKSMLTAPPAAADPVAEQQHKARQAQIDVWSKIAMDPNATPATKANALKRLNVLFGAETGAPPVQANFTAITPYQQAQLDQQAKQHADEERDKQLSRNQEAERIKLERQGQSAVDLMRQWTMSGGDSNPVNWNPARIMDYRAQTFFKTGAPSQQIAPDGKSLVTVAGSKLADTPQGAAAASYLNNLAFAKLHGLPLPKPPTGMEGAGAPAPIMQSAMPDGLTPNYGASGATGTTAPPAAAPPARSVSLGMPPPVKKATPAVTPKPKPTATPESRTYGGYSYTVSRH